IVNNFRPFDISVIDTAGKASVRNPFPDIPRLHGHTRGGVQFEYIDPVIGRTIIHPVIARGSDHDRRIDSVGLRSGAVGTDHYALIGPWPFRVGGRSEPDCA